MANYDIGLVAVSHKDLVGLKCACWGILFWSIKNQGCELFTLGLSGKAFSGSK